ncbi:MAG: hypothetical protein MUP81_05430 [Dehalococcoidia bacterium]|nr:hypothetical protein [Dehalococcoidia bacterium]
MKDEIMPSFDALLLEAIGHQTFDQLLREATSTVEKELAIEDKGWIVLSGTGGEAISGSKRIASVKQSRLYYALDPLARQSIRIWTDYTFGPGMTWEVDEEKAKATKDTLGTFWKSRDNQPLFGSRGQRKCSEKLLVDGEIFFALFLGNESRIRTIDPLEIEEIITDPDDIEKPMLYKRQWADRQGGPHTDFYPSYLNIKGEATKDSAGALQNVTQKALVYHLAFNTTGQRGNPLLLPALDWIKQYRRFLAARVGMMLARTRFAWRKQVEGGTAAVATVKGALQDKTPEAGAVLVENKAVSMEPIQTPQDARNAYDDARMLKLQVCAAVGIPEQYFGDIATGNLATAKTVELPMLKMFQSYQSVWGDAYQDIFDLVLEYNQVDSKQWYVDKDFPAIAPEDIFAAAQAIVQLVMAFPEFASAPDVQQQALIAMGVNDPAQVLEQLSKEAKKDPTIPLAKALREFKRLLEAKK